MLKLYSLEEEFLKVVLTAALVSVVVVFFVVVAVVVFLDFARFVCISTCLFSFRFYIYVCFV